MTIEVEVPLRTLSSLFDSETILSSMSREAPGGATIRFPVTRPEKFGTPEKRDTDLPPGRHRVCDAEPLMAIAIIVVPGVAIHLFGSWLYDKLKGEGKKLNVIRVNRTTMIEVTPEAITKLIQESIEIEERK